MTFYLKYRPQTIDELDLTKVREDLSQIIASGQLPHAFLFSGPRGAGKTSAARILAKVINCQSPVTNHQSPIGPCNKCEHCISITNGNNIDVIEMDAASNRGIDDVRSLRDQVALSPASAKKKVYIIDEAHMLTGEAANALLKTLEEPPAHVVFILATTDPEKLPQTILSRTTQINFTKASEEEIKRGLEKIAKAEDLKVSDEVYAFLAKHSDGSFRDAVKNLETLATASKNITLELAQEKLDSSLKFDFEKFWQALAQKDAKTALTQAEEYVVKGSSIKNLQENLESQLHKNLISFGVNGETTLPFNQKELYKLIALFFTTQKNLSGSGIPQLPLEVFISKWCQKSSSQPVKKKEPEAKTEPEKISQPEIKPEQKKIENAPKLSSNIKVDGDIWPKIMSQAKEKNSTIEALLRAAKLLDFDGSQVNIGVFYTFHKERLEHQANFSNLQEIITSVVGDSVKVTCTLTAPPPPTKFVTDNSLTTQVDKDIISAAKEIFDL